MNGSFPAQPDPRGPSFGLGPAVSRHLTVARPAAGAPAHPPRPFYASAPAAAPVPQEPLATEPVMDVPAAEPAAAEAVAEPSAEELPWLGDWAAEPEAAEDAVEPSPELPAEADEDLELLPAEAPWAGPERAPEPQAEPEPVYEPWISATAAEAEPAAAPDWELADEPEDAPDISAFAWDEEEPSAPPPAAEAPAEDPAEEAPAAMSQRGKALMLDEVANRLEQIARTLRERRPAEIFSEDPADPLEILITGYALGYTEATRHARQAQDRSSA